MKNLICGDFFIKNDLESVQTMIMWFNSNGLGFIKSTVSLNYIYFYFLGFILGQSVITVFDDLNSRLKLVSEKFNLTMEDGTGRIQIIKGNVSLIKQTDKIISLDINGTAGNNSIENKVIKPLVIDNSIKLIVKRWSGTDVYFDRSTYKLDIIYSVDI